MDFKRKADDIREKLAEYRKESDEWKLVKKSKEVTVSAKPSPEINGHLYKADGYIQVNPEKVFEFVNPNPNGPRAKWDKAIKSLELVEKIDEGMTVVRTCTHSAAMGLISSRDFLDLCITENTEDYFATVAQSIEHPKCPVDNKYVRGTNHPCGITCYRVKGDPDKTRLISFCHADLGGMLPKQLVESALPSNMVEFFINLRQALEEK